MNYVCQYNYKWKYGNLFNDYTWSAVCLYVKLLPVPPIAQVTPVVQDTVRLHRDRIYYLI